VKFLKKNEKERTRVLKTKKNLRREKKEGDRELERSLE
jgi:hypothetical protein